MDDDSHQLVSFLNPSHTVEVFFLNLKLFEDHFASNKELELFPGLRDTNSLNAALAQVRTSKQKDSYRVDSRVWVDLKGVDVISGVLEQPIVRIQHLM